MIVLHGLVTPDGAIACWAEDADLPARTTSKAKLARHPFALDAAALAELFAEQKPFPQAGRDLVVSLPSRGGTPDDSPELVRDPLTAGPAARGEHRLRDWKIPVVTPASAVLSSIVDMELPDGRVGADLRYLADIARWAEELVAAGKVVPGIAGTTRTASARWQAGLYGADAVRFTARAAALPAPCRAARLADPAEDVLRAAVHTMVDTIARERLAGQRLAPKLGKRPTPADATAHAWLTALTGAPEFDADAVEFGRLAGRLADWQASGSQTSPVRACFRLRSPEQFDDAALDDEAEAEEPVWRLEFLVQAVEEPSVLVSAEDIWSERDNLVLHRWVGAPQEVLLAELGRASRLFEPLNTALREPRPVELELDTDGAYAFLTHASTLDQAGFGVQLPSWWQQPVELGLKLTSASRGTAGVVAKNTAAGLKALVDYRWDLALGDAELTEAELRALAEAKVPLVRLRGQWVQVDPKRVAAGLAFLRRSGSGQMAAGQVLLRAAHPDEADLPLPVTGVADRGWLGDLLSGTVERQLEPVDPPPGFTATLRPYQRRGLAWLAFLDSLGLGACLADDMGLGKTVQLIALEALARKESPRPPTLVICPMSMVGTWQREAARFAPGLAVLVHHGSNRLTGEELTETIGKHDLVVTTYSLATKDSTALGEIEWDRVVLDEAQNIKNSASRQSQTVRQFPARHRIALTGTPVENRLAELWSIMDFANPGVLGSVNSFRARFSVPIERDNDTGAAARLRKLTGPFVLRRLKTDPKIIDDLPEKFELKQLCTLTAEQASLYQAVVDDMLARIEDSEGMERRGLVLATMSKLKQVCNHPAQLLGDGSRIAGRSGKLARLEDILAEALADGDKVLCFTQFAAFGGMLVPHLSARFDTEVLFLHGGTSKKAREDAVRRFQSPDGPKIFLLSLKAGGTGLTLTAANHVVHLDRWWNPAVEDQATDRAFRIGQRRDVQVRKFVCIGTLEEKIDAMIEEKKALAQLVVGAGENWLTELSTSQLRELVTLSSEAVID
ncbi:MAG TPA: DEAD/DEAH box helicase [Pseudonocardiaceae bacterium]|nr:DEAD/DEAH box helicase [Pseudonocardiaceae bacterium]